MFLHISKERKKNQRKIRECFKNGSICYSEKKKNVEQSIKISPMKYPIKVDNNNSTIWSVYLITNVHIITS